jgi:hypothetical protein
VGKRSRLRTAMTLQAQVYILQVDCLQQAATATTAKVAGGTVPYDRAAGVVVDSLARAPAPLVAVQSLCETTEAALPGVFTATLKVIIDIDAQPALERASLDQVVVNLLSCFAKCYGKGDAQNRRGIIRFAATKVTKFRTFVTLRFSVATRTLSRISKPLSLCNDPNFWYGVLSPASAISEHIFF